MIKDMHNSIYFWGAAGLVYVYFQFQQPPELLLVINPTQIYMNSAQPDTREVRVMCWDEVNQIPKECKNEKN